MAEINIICKPTTDTFVRFGIVLAAFFGFGLYFFYDGAVGYRKANEVFFSYQAFAQLGEQASDTLSADEWARERSSNPLLSAVDISGSPAITEGEHVYPLPIGCESVKTCPPEAADFNAMKKSWNDCWLAYTARMQFPATPAEHGYDEAAIREQWYAGGVCMLISAIILALILRTARRTMALRGNEVTAAGTTFLISDISRLDLRQWGKGFKGIAYATVNGKRIRMDGMTYGGFNPDKGEPAEKFMQALQEQYKGEILEYEQQD